MKTRPKKVEVTFIFWIIIYWDGFSWFPFEPL